MLRAVLLAAASARSAAFRLGRESAESLLQPTVFFALADWGGEQESPFVTPGQRAVATAMGTLAAEAGSHPQFVLAAGDNFYMDGLPGAQLRAPTNVFARAASCEGRLSPRRASTHRLLQWTADTGGLRPAVPRARSAVAERNDCQARGGDVPGRVHRARPAGALVFCGRQPRLGGRRTGCAACGARARASSCAVALRAPGAAAHRARALTSVSVQTAQVALNGSAATGGRWVMPSTYYTFTQTMQGGDTVQFVMVDTETLTGGVNPMPAVLPQLYYPPGPAGAAAGAAAASTARRLAEEQPRARSGRRRRGSRTGSSGEVGPVERAPSRRRLRQSSTDDPGAASPLDPPVPSSWVPPPVDEAQWTWVEQTLASSEADWIIVVGHHPVWSAGEYGPTWALVERLRPLMEQAGVALYLCGHEHQMEHFRPEPHASGVDYLVVGNGAYYNDTAPSDTSHARDCPADSLQFSYTRGTGFAALRLTPASTEAPSSLSATLYDDTGALLYAFSKFNPRTAPGHTAGNLGTPPAPLRFTHVQKELIDNDVLTTATALTILLLAMCGAAMVARRQVSSTAGVHTWSRASGAPGAWSHGTTERAPLVPSAELTGATRFSRVQKVSAALP